MPYHYNPSGYHEVRPHQKALLTAMMAEHQAQPPWRKPSELLVADFLARWLSTVVDPSTLAPTTKVLKRTKVQHAITYFPEKTRLVDVALL